MKKHLLSLSLLIAFVIISIVVKAQTPDWEWARSGASSLARSIANGSSGNIYVTGRFSGATLTLGSNVLTNTTVDNEEIFIAKYDDAGNVIWAKQFGGTLSDYATSITLDASENIYVTGYFESSTIDFGATTLTNNGSTDLFLVKLNSAGTVQWAKSAGSTSNDEANAVCTDASGNIFITGTFSSTILQLGSTALTKAGASDMFTAKYDASGNVLWAKGAGGPNYDMANSIAADNSGNVVVAGAFYSATMAFGSLSLNCGGYSDGFVVKYTASGTEVWVTGMGGSSYDGVSALSVDDENNIFVTGSFNSAFLNFGTPGFSLTNTTTPYYDLFIAKYGTGGNVIWTKREGGSDSDYSNSIKTDSKGHFYLTGNFSSSTLPMGSFSLTNTGGSDLFVAKYDTTGSVTWVKGATGTSNEYTYAVSNDDNDNVYAGGGFQSSSITFGNNTLNLLQGMDLFVAKIQGALSGIEEQGETEGINIYPNPATEKIILSSASGKGIIDVSVVNTLSQQVYRQQDLNNGTAIDISYLPSGIYYVRIQTNNTFVTKKLIIQHK